MVILDTSIWIEFFKGNEPFRSKVKKLLEEMSVIGIECVFGEILQGTRNKREIEIILAYWNSIRKTDEKNIWIDAGVYSARNHYISKGVGLIDAALIVIALKEHARIWSLDKKINNVLSKDLKFQAD